MQEVEPKTSRMKKLRIMKKRMRKKMMNLPTIETMSSHSQNCLEAIPNRINFL